MDIKQAVRLAKASVQDLFGDQVVSDPILEEMEFDDDGKFWWVTLGFFRVPDLPRSSPRSAALEVLDLHARLAGPRRAFKVFKINAETEKVVSVKDRELS
jgi:hypothetical protein